MKRKTIENMLLGIAIGDAFGLGIEFQDRNWIKQNIDFSQFVNKREGKYAENYELGYYSDDTEHSIGLVKAVIDPRPFSEQLLLEYWKKEYESDKQAKGFPRQGYGTIKDWYEGRKTIEEIKENSRKSPDPGCAPPMRAVPLGLIDSNLINKYATISAMATHPSQKAIDSSILVARASEFMLAKNGNANHIFEYCMNHISNQETLDYLTKIQKLPLVEELSEEEFRILCGPQPIPYFKYRTVIGLPNSAIRVAGATLYIVKQSPDAFSGLIKAIGLGGDVDSIASICTGILGGRYGLDNIPTFLQKSVEGKEELIDLADKFSDYLTLPKE